MTEFSTAQLLADISAALTPADFHAAARRNLAQFDALNQQIIDDRQVSLACGKGCSICCSLRVDVFAHEVLYIAEHIRSTYPPGKLADLLDRLEAHSAAVLPLTAAEHASTNITCPMLESGACSIYEVRPQSCRRHHSQDVAACQYTYDHPEDLTTPAAHHRELYRSLTAAMQQNIDAYSEAGYDFTVYELGTALHEALGAPSSFEHWQAKENTFIVASVTPTE